MANQSHSADAQIVKIDEDKRLVFGWASIIKDEAGKILLDRQDDFIDSEDELEKAAYSYVLHSRDGGEMHIRRGVAKMVESVVFTEEKQRALGIPVGSMPTGWWIGFKVEDDRVWEQVKKGEYAGFSVHGTGRRESTQLPMSKVTEIGKASMKKKKSKIATVMEEFKSGKLKSSSGEKVTDPKQAMAIAISEQKRAKMKKISVDEIVAKTEMVQSFVSEVVDKHAKHDQSSHGRGSRGAPMGRSATPRDKNMSGGGTGGRGGGKIPTGGKGKKAVDRAKAKQKARSEAQKKRGGRGGQLITPVGSRTGSGTAPKPKKQQKKATPRKSTASDLPAEPRAVRAMNASQKRKYTNAYKQHLPNPNGPKDRARATKIALKVARGATPESARLSVDGMKRTKMKKVDLFEIELKTQELSKHGTHNQ